MRSFKLITIGILFLSLCTSFTFGKDKEIKYSKTTQIVLNTSATGANTSKDLNNFPVLIKLDNTNFDFDVIKNDLAGDIAFSTLDGSFLSYKIQKWNKANKSAELLVIIPKLLGNNSTQYITISWGASADHISDQKIKTRIEEKKAHEADIAQSNNAGSSIFEASYGKYGVWSSNNTNGFNIVNNTGGM